MNTPSLQLAFGRKPHIIGDNPPGQDLAPSQPKVVLPGLENQLNRPTTQPASKQSGLLAQMLDLLA